MSGKRKETRRSLSWAPDRRKTAWKARRKAKGNGRPLVVFMTDADRTPDPARDLTRLAPGTIVIFRHYDAPDRAALGRRLRALARRRRLPFLVAGDWRLARRLNADGLHLPDGMVRRFRRFAPGGAAPAVSAAAHGPAAAHRAAREGADLVLFSPVFATASHPGRRPKGVLRLAAVARDLGVPVLALGGIAPANVRRVLATPAAGIAGIGGIAHLSRDPFALAAPPRRPGGRDDAPS